MTARRFDKGANNPPASVITGDHQRPGRSR
jgi:hypothetical protein